MAGNQLGKTLAGGFETAMHMTGRYPDWWNGKRFDRPVVGWICGRSGEDVRDGMQRILLGRPGQIGTGAIPKDAISNLTPGRGVSDLFDTFQVEHVSGGVSIASTKSYKAGREAFQGETLDFVSFDEEPPAEIYTEGLTRTNIGGGPVWLTFTPLLGMSEVVRRFLLGEIAGSHVTTMTIDDVDHYSRRGDENESSRAIRRMKSRRAPRAFRRSAPGAYFRLPRNCISCEHANFPTHWPRIGGMDFGWDHPFAAVELVWDRDTDTVYVTKTHRLREATPVIHAAAHASRGASFAGHGRVTAAAKLWRAPAWRLSKQYSEQGLDMLHDTCPIRGRQRVGRSRTDGDADPNADRPFQGVQAPQRLVGGISAVSPQGRQGGQRGRRPHGRHPLRR